VTKTPASETPVPHLPCGSLIRKAIQSGNLAEMRRLEKLGTEEVNELSEALEALRTTVAGADNDRAEPWSGRRPGRPATAIKLELARDARDSDDAAVFTRFHVGGGTVSMSGVGASVVISAGSEIAEKIVAPNDLMNIAWLSRGIEVSRAVARVHVPGGFGTGLLVAPGLLLTNHHVIPDIVTAGSRATVAEFGCEQDWRGAPVPSKKFKIVADEFHTNVRLDYSLIRVEGGPETEFGFVDIADYALPALHENVRIVQHPSGGPKQIALRNNTVTRIEGNFVRYTTDSRPGASGSPCFNRDWRPVALHRKGSDRPVATGGGEFINEGTLIASIVNDANDILRLTDPLEDLVFGPLLPMLTHVVTSIESPVPFVWVLNGYPRFAEALLRSVVRGFGDEGLPEDSSELSPVIAAALGVAAGAGIGIHARSLEILGMPETLNGAASKIRAIVDDVVRRVKDSRQVYQGLVDRIGELKRYVIRVIAESEAMQNDSMPEVFPVAVAAFLAGVVAGAGATRP